MALGLRVIVVGVAGEFEPFNGSGTLLRNVADNVCNCISLVTQVSVSDISHAVSMCVNKVYGSRIIVKLFFHSWSDILAIEMFTIKSACPANSTRWSLYLS